MSVISRKTVADARADVTDLEAQVQAFNGTCCGSLMKKLANARAHLEECTDLLWVSLWGHRRHTPDDDDDYYPTNGYSPYDRSSGGTHTSVLGVNPNGSPPIPIPGAQQMSRKSQ